MLQVPVRQVVERAHCDQQARGHHQLQRHPAAAQQRPDPVLGMALTDPLQRLVHHPADRQRDGDGGEEDEQRPQHEVTIRGQAGQISEWLLLSSHEPMSHCSAQAVSSIPSKMSASVSRCHCGSASQSAT